MSMPHTHFQRACPATSKEPSKLWLEADKLEQETSDSGTMCLVHYGMFFLWECNGT